MKNISLILVAFVLSLPLFALELKSGDLILISFNCYECRVIESETNSKFSHSGVILINQKNEIKVAQALGVVGLTSLQDFLKNKTPNTKASIYRAKEIEENRNADINLKMLTVFNSNFLGLKFDSKYFWNNVDENGNELLYCSEFAAKFLDHFLSTVTIPYPLTYQKNYDYWFKYFKGKIPEGELGNSPQSLADDARYFFVGEM